MNRPLNFLHLTTFYPPYSFGGDAMYLYRLCHLLGEEGHHVEVVHCVDSYHLLHTDPPPVQFREHPNVTRHELRSGFAWLSGQFGECACDSPNLPAPGRYSFGDRAGSRTPQDAGS